MLIKEIERPFRRLRTRTSHPAPRAEPLPGVLATPQGIVLAGARYEPLGNAPAHLIAPGFVDLKKGDYPYRSDRSPEAYPRRPLFTNMIIAAVVAAKIRNCRPMAPLRLHNLWKFA